MRMLVVCLLFSGCAYTNGTYSCPGGGGGSVTTLRLGTTVEASGPVCQAGTATVTSDPSVGTAPLTQALGVIEKLVTPGAVTP